MISPEKLHKLGIGSEWSEPLTTTFVKFGMVSPKEQACFIAQCSHESNHFKVLEENLNYRAETLQKLFGHKFKPEEIPAYARNPIKIANRIYANRMGNRDEASGDGWRFRGRGLLQLTGHDNVWHCSQGLGQDFVMNPDLLATPMWAAMSAGWFWQTHGCKELAESGLPLDNNGSPTWGNLTKRINGGLIGLPDRIAQTQNALAVLTS